VVGRGEGHCCLRREHVASSAAQSLVEERIFSHSMPVVSNVSSQHADEASFLWELRSGAVIAPHFSLADLAKLDQRIEANLDGLRIADDAGWEICREALSTEEPGEVFAAAVLAFESGNKDRLETVFEA